MGLICTKLAPNSVEENQGGTAETTTKKSRTANKKNAKSDAEEKPLKNELESIREKFRGTVYFDAIDHIEIDEDGKEKDEESFHYAPATGANPHPRASIAFDQSSTMLKKDHDKKQVAASAVIIQELKQPSQKVSLTGYPGDLTPKELEACQLFRRRLKQKDQAYYDMILGMTPAEEEPYAICRFMRARNFQVDDVIEMMDECIELWKSAAKDDYYPSVEQAVGHNAAIFFTQFPSVYCGLAKNGTVTAYMRAGSMSIEGMACLLELDTLSNYLWYTGKHKFPGHVMSLQEANPQVMVRCEEFYIVDLMHLTSSQVSKTAIDALKNMFVPAACFPEILNKLIVLNAPGFFSFVWRIVKVFLHPRTARKVEIFSDTEKGKRRLKELIDSENIPSDYGGQAPSLDEIVREQYCGEGRRQVHQLLSTGRNKKAELNFTLNAKEHASITVYTRSSTGAHFTIVSGSKSVAQSTVENKGGNGPYSKEIASKLEGPGTFSVAAQSKHTDHFLVIVSISM